VPRDDDGPVYFYGIVGRNRRPAGLVGVDGQMTAAIDHGELTAVVSPLQTPSLGDDVATLEAQVRAHEAVVEHLLANDTVLPTRFGTVVASGVQVRDLLAREQVSYLQALQRLAGTVEWGLSVTWDAKAARTHVAAKSTAVVSATAGPGKAYLLSQQQKKAVSDEVQSTRLALASRLHDTISASAVEAAVRPSRDGQTMVLLASYLVARMAQQPFRDGVDAALSSIEDAEPLRLQADLSGPWPPYSFVSLAEAPA
jgi:hypothetical protein